MPPGLSGGGSRWLLKMNSNQLLKMPPPCAVEPHVACYLFSGSAGSSQREPPRGKPVASKEGRQISVATNVRLHGQAGGILRTTHNDPDLACTLGAEWATIFANLASFNVEHYGVTTKRVRKVLNRTFGNRDMSPFGSIIYVSSFPHSKD